MRLTATKLFLGQIFISFITECLMVDGAVSQTRMKHLKLHSHNEADNIRHKTNGKDFVLMCRNKYYLILRKGKLEGSVRTRKVKRYGRFEVQTLKVGVVKFFNVRSKQFIAIDKNGKAYVTPSKTAKDTLFKETFLTNDFFTYHSYKNFSRSKNGIRLNWYLGIKGNKKIKRPSRIHSSLRRSIQFVIQPFMEYKQDIKKSNNSASS